MILAGRYDYNIMSMEAGKGVLAETRRIIKISAGFLMLLVGVALIFLPGPAFIVIPIGLALLATEFDWARNILRRFKKHRKDKSRL